MQKLNPHMAMRLLTVAMLLCVAADVEAGTSPIGTARARGDIRVDGYLITDNATLFDGALVETDQASAALRLEKGGEIRLSNHARGILYKDKFVLQQGSGEWAGSGAFPFELNSLLVTPSNTGSRGVVSMRTANTANVTTLTGELRVTSGSGLLVARVLPGSAYSFAAPQAGVAGAAATPDTVPMSLFGTLTKVDGRYILELPRPDIGVVYELKGPNLDKFVGKQIRLKGKANVNEAIGPDGIHVITISSFSEILPVGAPLLGTVGLTITIAAAAAATGVGIFEVVQALTPASR